jgi:dTDP-4-dehydrorhamnose reductase
VRVLLTGASGQIGTALREDRPEDIQLAAFSRTELDITDDRTVEKTVAEFRPDVVINAAAYTAVDRAEDEPELAAAVNMRGAANLARAASHTPGCRLLHISTDYVFDGRALGAYRPDDVPNPLNVYGRTKLAGEAAVHEQLGKRCVVLRTAWVYAATGKNFLLTMLRLMRERGAVRVVADQRGTPTAASSVSTALWGIARRADIHGIVHWTDAGTDTWWGFASAIAQDAHAAGLLTLLPQVTPIATAEFPTRARRPANSMLDTSLTVKLLGYAPAPWRVNLRASLTAIAEADRKQA